MKLSCHKCKASLEFEYTKEKDLLVRACDACSKELTETEFIRGIEIGREEGEAHGRIEGRQTGYDRGYSDAKIELS